MTRFLSNFCSRCRSAVCAGCAVVYIAATGLSVAHEAEPVPSKAPERMAIHFATSGNTTTSATASTIVSLSPRFVPDMTLDAEYSTADCTGDSGYIIPDGRPKT